MLGSHVESLLETLSGLSEISILTHTNPDPDAIASVIALRALLNARTDIKCRMVYSGMIGRAENKTLVRYLKHPLQRLSSIASRDTLPVIMADTQPGAGNNMLPESARVVAVIDHHAWREETAKAAYHDVRTDIGAACTILVEYLREAQVEIEPLLATALFYGIKTDTRGLGRNAAPADVAAYYYLQPRIDADVLSHVEQAPLPIDYFKDFHRALEGARIFDRLVVSNLGKIRYPDLTAEIADLLVRLEEAHWVVCTGICEKKLTISVRTRTSQGAAGVLRDMIGKDGVWGGHGRLAGGQIPLSDRDANLLVSQTNDRLMRHFGINPDKTSGRPLLD